jgi:hypothetical protein
MSGLSDKQACRPEDKRMTAALKFDPALNSLSGMIPSADLS